MHTTRKLKDMGAWVYMMQRSDKLRSEIEGMMAVCVKGDALDAESVGKVMKGALPHTREFWQLLHTLAWGSARVQLKDISCHGRNRCDAGGWCTVMLRMLKVVLESLLAVHQQHNDCVKLWIKLWITS